MYLLIQTANRLQLSSEMNRQVMKTERTKRGEIEKGRLSPKKRFSRKRIKSAKRRRSAERERRKGMLIMSKGRPTNACPSSTSSKIL